MYYIVRKPKVDESLRQEDQPYTKKDLKKEVRLYLKERFPYLEKDDIKRFSTLVVAIMKDQDMIYVETIMDIVDVVDIMVFNPLALGEEYSHEDYVEWVKILSRIKIDTKNLK